MVDLGAAGWLTVLYPDSHVVSHTVHPGYQEVHCGGRVKAVTAALEEALAFPPPW